MTGSSVLAPRTRANVLLPAPEMPITRTRRMEISALRRQPCCPQPREVVARMIGRARQRTGRDHQEALGISDRLVGPELVRRDEALHFGVLAGRLQVLPDGEKV